MIISLKNQTIESDDVLDLLSNGIIITNESFSITYFNTESLTLIGMLEEDLLNKSLLELHSFKNRKKVKYIFESFAMGTLNFWKKTIFYNEKFLDINLKPIRKNNQFRGVIAEFCDVTAMRHSKQSHDNLFRMYKMMFNSTQLAMLTIDKNKVVTSFNPAAEKLFGISKSEIIDKDFLETIYQHSQAQLETNDFSEFYDALEIGKEYQNLKKELSLNETKITILLDTCVMRNASGEVLGVLGVLKDITDYSLSENLAHRQDKYAVMAQLAAGLADEMRNPLTSVKGFMQLLNNRMKRTRQKEYVELALDELKRMEKHIRNFLLFSTPAAPVMKLGNINRLLKDVAADYKANLNNISIELTIPQEEFFICIDEEQIRHVFNNLLQNAVEAFPPQGGKIKIQLVFSKDFPNISIYIEDNGMGISEEAWPHIYEPFFTSKEYNSGLGLTIAQRIIQAHGGKLEGENNLFGGTTMKICLPFGAYTTNSKPIN